MRAVLRTVLSLSLALFALFSASFFLLRAAPGGPFDSERALGPELEALVQAKYGLNLPLWQQYLQYLADVLRLEFGPSLQYSDFSVGELIQGALPYSLLIGGLALVFAFAAGITLGILKQRPGARPWHVNAAMGFEIAVLSTPSFVIAPLLAWLFAVQLGWLPVAGVRFDAPRTWLLPSIALALPVAAVVARLVSAQLSNPELQPVLKVAEAYGASNFEWAWRYALPLCSAGLLGYLPSVLAALLTGSIVVEQVFGVPGLGRYFVLSAMNRDYTLLMGLVMLYGALLLIASSGADLLRIWIDPRLRN
jgi:oligopeptide transport system permease protein